MRHVLLLILLLTAGLATAEVYRRVDADGNVEFSDTPTDGAEVVELKEPTIVPGSPVKQVGEEATPQPSGEAYAPYESITVVAPVDDDTLRNQASVGVDVLMVPELLVSLGHRVQLYVDGEPFGAPSGSPHFLLPAVNRGTHQLAAAVLGPDGAELIRSPTSTFHMLKISVANPKTGQPGGIRPSTKPAK